MSAWTLQLEAEPVRLYVVLKGVGSIDGPVTLRFTDWWRVVSCFCAHYNSIGKP
jgi:hypothetical protein